MSADRPLAEIVAEGLRRHAEHDGAPLLRSLATGEALARYYSEHGPRLLAVAEKAMLVRREAHADTTHNESRCACLRCQRMRAFDAIAAPAPEGEGRNG